MNGVRRRHRNLIQPLLALGKRSEACAALHFVDGRVEEVSWGRVLERVRATSEALVSLGLRPGDRVAVFSTTRLDWSIADLAIAGARCVTVPIYATCTVEEIEHVLRDSGARAVVLDGEVAEGKAPGRWTRLRAALARAPAVEHVVAFDLPSDPAARLLSLADLETRGRARLATDALGLERRAAQLGPDDLACICYTTGTTGLAKGVLLTHGNWIAQAESLPHVGLMAEDDLVLLFLPLAHSFGKMIQSAWVDQGFPLAFARSPESVMDDAGAVRPTAIPAVPRLFEKIFARVVADGAATPGFRGRVFLWAMREFERYAAATLAAGEGDRRARKPAHLIFDGGEVKGRPLRSLRWAIARALVFRKIRARLAERTGGRLKGFISGSAPLSGRLALFFEEVGLPILEGYGLTETAAPTHVNRLDFIRPGTVGLPFPGVETRIAADGEILLRGPQVMRGYHGRADLTAEVLDADGWFHTGDIGEVDADGCLRITDRKKDLIKTTGGKTIAPVFLEQALSALPLVSHAVVVGDRRSFVAALLTIAPEEAARWATDAGLGETPYHALVRRPELEAELRAGIDVVNASLPSYARIKRFAVLDRELSVEEGELTAKLSVRRRLVTERFRAVIDAMYGEAVAG